MIDARTQTVLVAIVLTASDGTTSGARPPWLRQVTPAPGSETDRPRLPRLLVEATLGPVVVHSRPLLRDRSDVEAGLTRGRAFVRSYHTPRGDLLRAGGTVAPPPVEALTAAGDGAGDWRPRPANLKLLEQPPAPALSSQSARPSAALRAGTRPGPAAAEGGRRAGVDVPTCAHGCRGAVVGRAAPIRPRVVTARRRRSAGRLRLRACRRVASRYSRGTIETSTTTVRFGG